MKNIIRNIALIVALGFGPAIFPQAAIAQDSGDYQYGGGDEPQNANIPPQQDNNNDDVYNQGATDIGGLSYQNFYTQLSPYGRWIYDPAYGYVWQPYAGAGFMPYSTAGHWVYTDMGWSWASDYAWGWAPFHYGRWDYTAAYGWYWIPGTIWGPAWVSWRYTDGYYGWAPIGPRCGYGYYYPASRWTFCQNAYFGRVDAYRFYSPRGYNEGLCGRSALVRNTYFDNGRRATYFSGPRRDEVERFTGARVNSIAVRENERQNFSRNNYNAQRQNNNVQRQSYNAPRQNNNVQRQSYNAPRQNNNVQRQSYSAPRQNNYSRQSYSAPRQSFASHGGGSAGRSGGFGGGGGGRRSR